MAVIAIALQQRLCEAAARELGPYGDVLLAEAAGQLLDTPFESLRYDQLAGLFAALEHEMASLIGRAVALTLADEIERFRLQADLDLGARVSAALTVQMGALATPFLARACRRLDLGVEQLHRGHLTRLAAVVEADAAAIAGPEAAAAVGRAVEQVRAMHPPGFVDIVLQIAAEHLGTNGEPILRAICQDHVGRAIDDLNLDDLPALAAAVIDHGPPLIGPSRTAAFLAAARDAIVGPGATLRDRLLDLVRRQLGPAGAVFLRRTVERNGVPFDAISYEHLAWLGEVVRREAAPLAGEAEANAIAGELSRLQPERAAAHDATPPAGETPPGGRFADPFKGLRDAARGWLRA